jgi:hypothetical protein
MIVWVYWFAYECGNIWLRCHLDITSASYSESLGSKFRSWNRLSVGWPAFSITVGTEQTGVVLTLVSCSGDAFLGSRSVWCLSWIKVLLKANSHMPSRYHAVPLPCRAALIHTCHAAPLPFSESAVSFVKVRVVARNIRIANPTVKRIGRLLITTFVELRVVAGRSRTRAGRPHAVSGRPMLIHTCHAMPMPCPCRAVPWPW